MAHYKDQHYLPSGYLRFFSAKRDDCAPDSIWRIDLKGQQLVPIRSQCSGDYFYSKANAAETEKKFSISEAVYSNVVNKLKSGMPLENSEYWDILLLMFDFHIRNAAHKNLTGLEGIEAYRMMNSVFMGEILMGRKSYNASIPEVAEYFQRFWSIKIFSAVSPNGFATSDHPSVWTSLRSRAGAGKSKLDMVMMPLTPLYMAIGFDRRIVETVNDSLTLNDEGIVNQLQLRNSVRCVYAAGQIGEEQVEAVKLGLQDKVDLNCEIDQDTWRLVLLHLAPENQFSFMRLRPPLL